jgi:hypothetical protein
MGGHNNAFAGYIVDDQNSPHPLRNDHEEIDVAVKFINPPETGIKKTRHPEQTELARAERIELRQHRSQAPR